MLHFLHKYMWHILIFNILIHLISKMRQYLAHIQERYKGLSSNCQLKRHCSHHRTTTPRQWRTYHSIPKHNLNIFIVRNINEWEKSLSCPEPNIRVGYVMAAHFQGQVLKNMQGLNNKQVHKNTEGIIKFQSYLLNQINSSLLNNVHKIKKFIWY